MNERGSKEPSRKRRFGSLHNMGQLVGSRSGRRQNAGRDENMISKLSTNGYVLTILVAMAACSVGYAQSPQIVDGDFDAGLGSCTTRGNVEQVTDNAGKPYATLFEPGDGGVSQVADGEVI